MKRVMKRVERVATREDIRRAAGRLIVTGIPRASVDAEAKEIIREVKPAGIILFARNVESPEQVAELNRELKLLRRDEPLSLSVDQEGGRVARVRAPATEWPPMRALGTAGDPDLARRFGRALGRELRSMSFDVDYAPVLDVDTNPDNPVIGDRSLGRDPSVVGRLACAVIAGLRDANTGACGKHFPGHGDTSVDSHFALPQLDHDLDRLQEVEWPPFAAAVQAGLDAVMSAHVLVPVLDREHPGTLSAAVLSRLRDELRFDGVIVSDDIDMKAVADRFAPADIATLGLEAGIDVFLACNRPDVAIELYRGIVHAVEQGRISHDVLLDAADRADAWYRRWWRPPSRPEAVRRWVGCAAHQELAAEIRSAAAEQGWSA